MVATKFFLIEVAVAARHVFTVVAERNLAQLSIKHLLRKRRVPNHNVANHGALTACQLWPRAHVLDVSSRAPASIVGMNESAFMSADKSFGLNAGHVFL